MVGLDELRAQVAASYNRLGMPAWPNPHPDMAPPRDEEYSRLTEPERYRVVHVRARAWADRLADLPEVDVDVLAPAPLDDDGHLGRFDRGLRLASSRPNTLPLLFLERDVRWPGVDGSLAVLHVSVVRPQVAVAVLPDCGCDACDFGSDDLLQAIDDAIAAVVGGPFVVLQGSGWHALWHPDGGSSGGTGRFRNHRELMELCRRLAGGERVRLPAGSRAYVGRTWLN